RSSPPLPRRPRCVGGREPLAVPTIRPDPPRAETGAPRPPGTSLVRRLPSRTLSTLARWPTSTRPTDSNDKGQRFFPFSAPSVRVATDLKRCIADGRTLAAVHCHVIGRKN